MNEAKYMELLQSLQNCISIMLLLQELKRNVVRTLLNAQNVYWKALEDNSGALELARTPKIRPLTKLLQSALFKIY